jgi:drug/metabolite transporter (DMT)-like permease
VRRKQISRHEEPWDIEHYHPEAKGSPKMLIALILTSVLMTSMAQILLKHGMNQVVDRNNGKPFSFNSQSLRLVATTPWIWVGLALFGFAAILWLMVLSRAALSFAYPFAALTYVVIVVYDAFRNEPVGALRWSGALLIVAGILLVSRTSHTT